MKRLQALVVNELRLMMRSKMVLGTLVVTIAISLLGVTAMSSSNDATLHNLTPSSSTMAVGVARYGALAGSLLFGLLAVLTLAKDDLKRSRPLTSTCLDEMTLSISRIIAASVLPIISTLFIALGTFMIHLALHTRWIASVYALALGGTMLGSMVCGVLLASAFYLASSSVDLSILLLAASSWFGLNSPNYLLAWNRINTALFSELAGIKPVSGMILYGRLTSLLIASALLLMGLAMHRVKGLTVWPSLTINIRRSGLAVVLILTMACSAMLYAREPYLFPNDSTMVDELPIDDGVELLGVDAAITLQPATRSLQAKVNYRFAKQPGPRSIEMVTNAGLPIQSARVNGVDAVWEKIPRTDRIRLSLPDDAQPTLEVSYRGVIRYPVPSGFPGYITNQSVALLENTHWLFQPQTSVSPSLLIHCSITAPSSLTVVSGGTLKSSSPLGDSVTWEYEAVSQSLDLAVFAAPYMQEMMHVGSTTIELYYLPAHQGSIRSSSLTSHIQAAVDYYQETLGSYPHPYPLRIVESSVYKPCGHSSHNVVSVDETVFNRRPGSTTAGGAFTLWRDTRLVAHEIAHQWWGTGVEIVGSLPWSSEGLAEYAAIKFLEKQFGPSASRVFTEGWSQSVATLKNGWSWETAGTSSRWSAAIRRKQELERKKIQAYYEMPHLLLEAERDLGSGTFAARMGAIYRGHMHGTLSFEEFIAEMGLTKEAIAHD
ncbi:MAG: hypothetical protein ACM3ZQ_00640 [Bacillota bacterium]